MPYAERFYKIKELKANVKLAQRHFARLRRPVRMRLAILCVFVLRVSGSAQVIFSAGSNPNIGMFARAPAAVRPDLVLAVPGEYSGGTAFTGRMRPRVFAYDAMQTKPATRAEPAAFLSPYPGGTKSGQRSSGWANQQVSKARIIAIQRGIETGWLITVA